MHVMFFVYHVCFVPSAQLSDAHLELEEVRKQILYLGDQLLEEQEINKRSKEMAATLQCKRF